MAETAQREGAPDQKAVAEGGPDPDELHAVQKQILDSLRPTEATDDSGPVANEGDELKNRRFTGVKRAERVGPLRFEPEEHPRLSELLPPTATEVCPGSPPTSSWPSSTAGSS
ncbi:hypothetical protein [Streptomyces sp. RPT161]|uniref:hypothetical protein n=1 Tax=Streptomyces sp. RPT161 TaxID=3015993 RepID=UPI002FD797DB